MQYEGQAALAEGGPDGIVIRVPGRAAAGRIGGYPHGAETELVGVGNLTHRDLGIVQGNHRDADEPFIGVAEFSHRTIVCPGRGEAYLQRFRLEDQPRAERREHDLTLKTEQVQGGTTFVPAGSAKGVMPFRPARQAITKGRKLGDDLGRMPPPVDSLAHVELAARIELGKTVAHARIRVGGEKVRQLHQVAVGVVDQSPVGVAHVGLLLTSRRRAECGTH